MVNQKQINIIICSEAEIEMTTMKRKIEILLPKNNNILLFLPV